MSRNGIKYRSSWTLHDENIENVERVCLTAEAQRELGCAVGEHVFLEYPWAYVSRETVSRLANTEGSPLELYRDKIEMYGGDTFLVGYSSTQLSGCDFVICLTEDARSVIAKRNADISRRIWNEVIQKIRRTGGSWKTLASETTLDETSIKNTRELFEVEVSFPLKSLGLNRKLCDRLSGDSSDSYVELIPYERFENIRRRCISRMIQTHLEPREIQVQTYPGYPKNAWTQYVYKDILPSEADDDELEKEEEAGESEEKRETEESKDESEVDAEEKPIEKSSLELFLEARAQEMIDAVCYNTVMNVYVDDIETLARREFEASQQPSEITFAERYSFIHLRSTADKVISDASWHPSLADYVVVSYVTIPSCETPDRSSSSVENDAATSPRESTVLLWSLADSLRPKLLLRCHQDIYCVSFCPTNSDFIIGGSASGQVVVWNIHGRIADRSIDEVEMSFAIEDIVPEASVTMISNLDYLHQLPIRRIQWLPDNYRIEPSGKLTKLSSHSSCQFVTISDDGIVAIWDLLKYSITFQLKPSSGKDFDNTFRPTYRLNVRTSKDPSFTPLCLCLPSDSVFQKDDKRRNQLDSTDVDDTKRLWIGMAQGQFVCCTWEGQDTETTDLEEGKLLGCISAHDGPVVAIRRSPHVPDILLTIGGHVFAIWKDDFLDLPLFRRKSSNIYTACCWGNRPGTLLMGTKQGDLEIWDIKRRADEPIRIQTISRKPIIALSLQESCKHGFKLIGVGDCNGIFRIFEESAEFEDNMLERMDWFEEFIWRETKGKKIFFSWQKDFLENDPIVVAKRQARAEEERKLKLEAARLKLHKEHEERLRLEAEEKKRKAPKSKDTMWKLRQQETMKKILLEKKKFSPQELEEKRQPLVRLAEERDQKMMKAKNQVSLCDQHFRKIVSRKFPEFHDLTEKDKSLEQKHEVVQDEKAINALLQEFYKVRDEVRKTIAENKESFIPKFDWNTCVKKDKERLQNMKHS